jgi:hypothetical protein
VLRRSKSVGRLIFWDVAAVSGVGVFWELRHSKAAGGRFCGISALSLVWVFYVPFGVLGL